jgi:hypothetical protein
MTTPQRARNVAAASLTTLLLAACASTEAPKPAAPQATIEAPTKAWVGVTDAEAGARIVVARTQTLVVSLAVAGNQNSDWSVVDLKPGVLRPAGSKFERALRDTDAEESAGSTVFRFMPEAAGEVTLGFELRLPHAVGAPLRTVSYAVTVK